MDPATIALIGKLVETVVPMLFGLGRGEDARELERLHADAKSKWASLENWANQPTRPPAGQTFRDE